MVEKIYKITSTVFVCAESKEQAHAEAARLHLLEHEMVTTVSATAPKDTKIWSIVTSGAKKK